MKIEEIRERLDNLLESFNPQDCDVTNFKLSKEEYELIVNTAWQLKRDIKEVDVIKPDQILQKIHCGDVHEMCIARLLCGLINKCGMHVFYFSNKH